MLAELKDLVQKGLFTQVSTHPKRLCRYTSEQLTERDKTSDEETNFI